MTILLAYLIQTLIGFLLIHFILGPTLRLSFSLHVLLSIGLGLGICGIATFFFLLVIGHYIAWGIILLWAFLLAILLGLNIYFNPDPSINLFPGSVHSLLPRYAIPALFWILATSILIVLSQQYPFGGWDAWALYNMKAKFLIEGGKNWTDIVQLHWHTQPSYPLLLPLINAGVFAFLPKNLISIASATGVLFSFSCALLLYAGLKQFIPRLGAFLASLLLLTNPNYIFWSTIQYADILLAYYLLASMILTLLTLHTHQPRFAFLTGLFWGILPFVKNEGAVFVFFFVIGVLVFLTAKRHCLKFPMKSLAGNLFAGTLATALPTLIFKIFMAPATREVLYNPFSHELKYFNLGGLMLTIRFYLETMSGLGWTFVWAFLGLVCLISIKRWMIQKESWVMSFVLCGFLAVLLYVYIATAHFDLIWRLECTASRILLYLLPSALFSGLYTLLKTDARG